MRSCSKTCSQGVTSSSVLSNYHKVTGAVLPRLRVLGHGSFSHRTLQSSSRREENRQAWFRSGGEEDRKRAWLWRVSLTPVKEHLEAAWTNGTRGNLGMNDWTGPFARVSLSFSLTKLNICKSNLLALTTNQKAVPISELPRHLWDRQLSAQRRWVTGISRRHNAH